MKKLIILQDILQCIEDCRAYQNALKDTLLQVQDKLRWITIARKKNSKKRQNTLKKVHRKRIPFHPCYQLMNILKTQIKRPHFPIFTYFPPGELEILKDMWIISPNNWLEIGKKMGKHPIECFRNYQRQIKEKSFGSRLLWTEDEDSQLYAAVGKVGKKNWTEVANYVDGKASSQCYHRYMKTLNPKIKRGKWELSEDLKLILGVKLFSTNWVLIENLLKTRTDIQCRERYCNVLNPALITRVWTGLEDIKLIVLTLLLCKKWSKIARYFEGRTDNQCWRRSKILIREQPKRLAIISLMRLFPQKAPKLLLRIYTNISNLIITS
ncbi:hypothetical protein SteCoe_18989 [Stentor coeruleus]|uniref:Myb-like domain-containing protein n=1 Tax=Stentor coeruleus TaxID=5963 RepID=A0A1R2BV38_9CILI|nr:hypothetical protein SteCoe_18989 [Stentor coeruleus]